MPVYLDHAATTTLAPEALAALTRELARTGNPSSLHGSGRRARRSVEDAREVLAAAAGAHPSEVIFTSGGTEADNLAVKGLYWARRAEDPARTRILCSAVEHHAVLDTVEWLERHEGADVSWLPVDDAGVVDLAVLEAELSRDPGIDRTGERHVGQQRGRHHPARRPGCGTGTRRRRTRPLRRRPGLRLPAR